MIQVYVTMENCECMYRAGKTNVVGLRSATCTIAPGTRVAVLGPSGSGKSTLLHLMAGLQAPTSGALNWPAFRGESVMRPYPIGMVFQSESLLPPLTVVENVELPLLLMGENAHEARSRALHALEQIMLAHISNKLPEELSGGQAQRVAVARTLVTRPKLFLADEPTGQLDHQTASELMDTLLGALEGTDTALVMATHDMEVASKLEEVWRVHDGILEVSQ